MVTFIKSVTMDCHDALATAQFWAAALGSNVDEDTGQPSRRIDFKPA